MSPAVPAHRDLVASPWVARWLKLVAPASRVLDVACGSGRHSRLAAAQGHRVIALDRDADALSGLSAVVAVRPVLADLEAEDWRLNGERFDAVIVTNYLHRPLFAELVRSVCASGLLIYETFAIGNERYGRPSNPAYLLESGELIDRVRPHLRVLAYEDTYVATPKPAMVQRICACGPDFQWPETIS